MILAEDDMKWTVHGCKPKVRLTEMQAISQERRAEGVQGHGSDDWFLHQAQGV